MVRALGSFQNGVDRQITDRQPKIWEEGVWEYPHLAAAIEEEVFEDIEDYLIKRQNTVAQHIVMQTIMDLCKNTVHMPGSWLAQRWWEQEGVELAGARARAAAAEAEADREEERIG